MVDFNGHAVSLLHSVKMRARLDKRMDFVKQQHPRGCCVACCAMLTGLTYDKVWNDQTSVFSAEEVLNLEVMHWSFYLSHLRFEVGRLYMEDGPLLRSISSLQQGVRYFCGFC